MMNFSMVWLIVGSLLGWVVSTMGKSHSTHGATLYVGVGMIGASMGDVLMSLWLGAPFLHQTTFSVVGLVASLFGALVLLAVAHFIRRSMTR